MATRPHRHPLLVALTGGVALAMTSVTPAGQATAYGPGAAAPVFTATPAVTSSKAARLAADRRYPPAVTPPPPTPPVTLPLAVDRVAGYTPQISCDPTDKPGTLAYADLLKSWYPSGRYGLSRACTEPGTSEHKDGRAVDFMMNAADPAQRRIADAIVGWITADGGMVARRLGVMYLIWNHRIWGSYDIGAGWQPYTGPVPHTDHIHTSLTWDGAMKRTSWWTGVALTTWDEGPCRADIGELAPIHTTRNIEDCPRSEPPPSTTHPSLVLGASGAEVTMAQRLLGVSISGRVDYATWMAVRRWQSAHRIAVTGVIDQRTWSLLDPGSVRR
ncbi:hypothetical protein KEM60_02999 [Austwickia sp. TVS 96-490-7B]|uniref:peptidoglycan-binding domain-containing protein n=1 Tax=Austwickia sp. TVS 96-490-7B TaxID=2830843 RepID=UPI001C58F1AC|nr:peptidoglycan-binding domain-containing protein [Austwickia sp. TVS 96-490-7B]MBW3086770.1 hypothetical protein [Austwickia sp. TVS 96-490-7B]